MEAGALHVFLFSLRGQFPGETANCGPEKENLIQSSKLTSILKYIYPVSLDITNTVWPVLKPSPDWNNCWQDRKQWPFDRTSDGQSTWDLGTRIMRFRNMPAQAQAAVTFAHGTGLNPACGWKQAGRVRYWEAMITDHTHRGNHSHLVARNDRIYKKYF